ncbi:MAG: ABC transporter ATP-binding protein [Candidatus Tectomicrobia bacterium]|uniref:ABC transporter ATP-binding protein n=1 Tax=Tectimicrobiota bacterium TaxID=2528274 RepID=A0A932GQH7_UNCTE|nr:ABC transporter ATP-binding protein [Candidatus Tectomicrobia bacterium]
MLEVQDIHTYYGDSYVLQGTSLKVGVGSVAALLGRNGVGKTTLIRSIIGFTPPRRFPSLSVRENVQIATRPQAKDAAQSWTMEKLFTLFPVLKERIRHRGSKLSGGEQQMLASGRALMGNPQCLLMDEPTEGLAPLIVREMGRLIEQIKEHGLSILLIEQNLAFALKHADYVYIMSKGRIVYQSSPQELWKNAEVKSRYLGV